MILPLFDYSGFLTRSCNLGQKRELQQLHYSCIRACLLYNHIDHVRIDRLHSEMKLVSLEQRRQIQCLMYRLSKKDKYIRRSAVNTRTNVKTKFKVMTKCTSKYLGSLWDKLDKNIQ